MVKQKKISKVRLSSEILSQKVKKMQKFDKNPLFWDFDRFWPFLDNEWSKNLQIWPCFTLFCPLANWFEVLPLGTFPSIQSGPRDRFSSPYLPPPSAAAHPALPYSSGAEGVQKKEETPVGVIRASNSF